MTYGADDVQFVNIVEACIESDLTPKAPLQCVPSNPGSTVENDFFAEKPALADSYRAIASRDRATRQHCGSAPGAQDHLHRLHGSSPTGSCNDTWPLTDAQVSYLNTLLGQLNLTIRNTVTNLRATDPNVSFAEISGAIAGHTWCTSDPWDYGLSVITQGGHSFLIGGASPLSNAPFHPTPAGQVAIAKLVRPVVAAALGVTGTGASFTSASGNGGGSADGVSVEPGDPVSVDGSGFAPDETVDETLHSAPVALGSVTANASGNVSTTVTIPTGTPAGPHELLLTGETGAYRHPARPGASRADRAGVARPTHLRWRWLQARYIPATSGPQGRLRRPTLWRLERRAWLSLKPILHGDCLGCPAPGDDHVHVLDYRLKRGQPCCHRRFIYRQSHSGQRFAWWLRYRSGHPAAAPSRHASSL